MVRSHVHKTPLLPTFCESEQTHKQANKRIFMSTNVLLCKINKHQEHIRVSFVPYFIYTLDTYKFHFTQTKDTQIGQQNRFQ